MIDGNFTSINGWAVWRGEGILDPTRSENALLTLADPLAAGAYSFTFTLYQLHGNPGHVSYPLERKAPRQEIVRA
jgi:hypothetical protein